MSSHRKPRWKLSTISNVTLLVIYLLGSLALVSLININAKQQALRNVELYSSMILDRNVVTHAFFNNAIKTSLYTLSEEHYMEPTWMSSTFAINSVAKDYGLFTQEGLYYKESTINARNPAHEADPLERDFILKLNNDPQLITQSAIREYGQEPFFTVMRRGQTIKEDCLLCHGNPEDAPPGIVSHYGSERGFNKQAGQVASAISIRIPLAMAYQDANHFSLKLSGILLVLLLVIFIFQYVASRLLLFTPIRAIHSKAKVIAFEPEHLGEELPVPAGRELAEMVEAFNAMSIGLRQHQDSLEETILERTAELEAVNLALNQDIEMRKKIERDLEKLSHHNEMILNTTSEGIIELDMAGTISSFNRAAAIMLGLDKEHINRTSLLSVLKKIKTEPLQPDPAVQVMETLKNGSKAERKEGLLARTDGHYFPIEYSCAPLRKEDLSGAVFSFRDITERKRSDQKIQNLAFYDQLTELPNRTLFYDRISQRVAQAKRDSEKLALMFLDLDDFKIVNDTLGHAAGDEFLRVIARRLKENSRLADTVARLGGDEFVWFGEIIDEEDARMIAGKFLQSISLPVKLEDCNFSSTVSIGIALFPESAEDVVGLMKCADTAMYSAKKKSKNTFHFYRKVRGS